MFGRRFQNELVALKRDVAKWQKSPQEGVLESPPLGTADGNVDGATQEAAGKSEPLDEIPLLDSKVQALASSTGVEGAEANEKEEEEEEVKEQK